MFTTVIILILALILGFVFGLIFSGYKNKESVKSSYIKLSEYEEVKSELNDYKKQMDFLVNDKISLEKEIAVFVEKNSNLLTSLSEKKDESEVLKNQLEVLSKEILNIKNKLTEEQTRIEERENQITQLKKQFEEQKKQLKDEFKNISNEILKEKEDLLKKENSSSINHILQPLKQQIDNFQTRVNQVNDEQTKNNSKLITQITNLHEMNENLKSEAENLAKALKNDKKTLGNWGEIQVEKLLEDSGLHKGREYKREDSFKDTEGSNKRPDFVIYLPDKKHIIIDSKVSLNSYVESVHASTSDEQKNALNNLSKCIRNHITSLSDKNYSSLLGVNSPDFVFMFMPIESAYIAAFENEPSLFEYAYKNKIAVVTPNTLLPILRTVASLWDIEKQNQHTKDIAESAGKVYDKLATFTNKFNTIERNISTLISNYNEAKKTLSGPRSLYNLVQNFKEQGVKVKKELPEVSNQTLIVNHNIEE